MPVIKITKYAVDSIEFAASGQVIYKDAQLKGFGLKVGTGTKTYIAEGTPNGRTRLVTIGRHGVITTEQARKKAQAILQDMREGVDPNKVKKQARAKQLTLREAADLYLNAPKVRAPATLTEYKATLNRYFRDWLDRPLSEITRKDCYDRHRKIGKAHGTYAANGAMRAIRATYNRALKQFEDLPPVNPVIAVDWYPEEVRDAAIAAEDLAEWYQGIHRLPNLCQLLSRFRPNRKRPPRPHQPTLGNLHRLPRRQPSRTRIRKSKPPRYHPAPPLRLPVWPRKWPIGNAKNARADAWMLSALMWLATAIWGRCLGIKSPMPSIARC